MLAKLIRVAGATCLLALTLSACETRTALPEGESPTPPPIVVGADSIFLEVDTRHKGDLAPRDSLLFFAYDFRFVNKEGDGELKVHEAIFIKDEATLEALREWINLKAPRALEPERSCFLGESAALVRTIRVGDLVVVPMLGGGASYNLKNWKADNGDTFGIKDGEMLMGQFTNPSLTTVAQKKGAARAYMGKGYLFILGGMMKP